MILFPLMTTWMWFQIFTASPLPFSGRLVEAYMARETIVASAPPDEME